MHAKGSFITTQLWAHGRAIPDEFATKNDVPAVSASDIPLTPNKILPHPLTHDEIKTYVKAYAQAAVNAIRAAGATSQFILIPGSSWSSAQALPTEAGPYLLKVTDPAGGTAKLLFDG